MGQDKKTKPILFSSYSGSETNNQNTTHWPSQYRVFLIQWLFVSW